MTASELTRKAYERHRSGHLALWLTFRAIYAGFREAGYGVVASAYCAARELLA